MCQCNNKCSCDDSSITEGLNGYNAFTFTSASFAIPAADGVTTVTINVKSDRPNSGFFAAPGQMLIINSNYFRVVSSTENTIVVVNPQTSTLYTTNAAPGTLIPANTKVSPTGEQGPIGPTPIVPIYKQSGVIYFSNTNTVQSIAYMELDFLFIQNLVTNGDSIEIESVVRYNDPSTTTLGGYKFQVDGSDIQEYTSINLADPGDIKYVIHKAVITRINQLAVSIESNILATDSSGLISESVASHIYVYTSPAVFNAENLPVRFLLRNNNAVQLIPQVILQVKYNPYIA